MLGLIKDLLTGPKENNEEIINRVSPQKKVQIATCALFLEVANSDDDFAEEEKEKIYESMRDIFGLEDEYINELISLSKEQIQKSVKYDVVKNLWKLIYADNKVDQYENLFIHRISNNFHLEHKDLIAAKLEAKKEHE